MFFLHQLLAETLQLSSLLSSLFLLSLSPPPSSPLPSLLPLASFLSLSCSQLQSPQQALAHHRHRHLRRLRGRCMH